MATPSIAPHWNWNRVPALASLASSTTFNRTSLELKYYHWIYNDLASEPSIAPHWNWNVVSYILANPFLRPSIAPHWNWNSITQRLNGLVDKPSIAPHWNWNLAVLPRLAVTERPFNRTSLELKYKAKWGILNDTVNLQSHLTGIEIFM